MSGAADHLGQGVSAQSKGLSTAFLCVIMIASIFSLCLGTKFSKPLIFIAAFMVFYYFGTVIATWMQGWGNGHWMGCNTPFIIAIIIAILAACLAACLGQVAEKLLAFVVGFVLAVFLKDLFVAIVLLFSSPSWVAGLNQWWWIAAIVIGALTVL